MIHICWKYLNSWLFFCIVILFWRLFIGWSSTVHSVALASHKAYWSKPRGKHCMMPAAHLHVAVVLCVMIIDVYWRFICSFFPALFSSDSFGGEIVYQLNCISDWCLLATKRRPYSSHALGLQCSIKAFLIFWCTGQVSQRLVNFTLTLCWHASLNKESLPICEIIININALPMVVILASNAHVVFPVYVVI